MSKHVCKDYAVSFYEQEEKGSVNQVDALVSFLVKGDPNTVDNLITALDESGHRHVAAALREKRCKKCFETLFAVDSTANFE